MALLYLSVRNLWTVILCHALVDSVALLTIYSGHRSLLFP
jgi:membrane protease YdiL (CAAX protease family)